VVASVPEILRSHGIADCTRNLRADEIAYLQQQGAFSISHDKNHRELIRCYVEFVHPFLPILELRDFLSSFNTNGGGGMISLLLYQSVCFAASAYVDMAYLESLGYLSRKAARKDLFRRARLLYDFGTEENRVILAQSALLLSFWYESPNECKDGWYYLGLAINWAKALGMNESASYISMHRKQSRLWRRIWWSCYTRDRMIALGMHRSMHIRASDFDIVALSMEDFDVSPLPTHLSEIFRSPFSTRDPIDLPFTEMVAKLCIEYVNLCTCIYDVLTTQYSINVDRPNMIHGARNLRLRPKTVRPSSSEIKSCHARLETWYQQLSPEVRYEAFHKQHMPLHHNDMDTILLHQALLMSLYFTASAALHRPAALHEQDANSQRTGLEQLAIKTTMRAADQITAIYEDLDHHDLIRFLPNTGVTCLITAVLAHLANCGSPGVMRQLSASKARFCLQVLQDLAGLYDSAQVALSYLINSAYLKQLSSQGLQLLPNPSSNVSKSGLHRSQQRPHGNPGTPPETAQLLSSITITPQELNLLTNLSQQSDQLPNLTTHSGSQAGDHDFEADSRKMAAPYSFGCTNESAQGIVQNPSPVQVRSRFGCSYPTRNGAIKFEESLALCSPDVDAIDFVTGASLQQGHRMSSVDNSELGEYKTTGFTICLNDYQEDGDLAELATSGSSIANVAGQSADEERYDIDLWLDF
jgi:hypothetical protein